MWAAGALRRTGRPSSGPPTPDCCSPLDADPALGPLSSASPKCFCRSWGWGVQEVRQCFWGSDMCLDDSVIGEGVPLSSLGLCLASPLSYGREQGQEATGFWGFVSRSDVDNDVGFQTELRNQVADFGEEQLWHSGRREGAGRHWTWRPPAVRGRDGRALWGLGIASDLGRLVFGQLDVQFTPVVLRASSVAPLTWAATGAQGG